MDRNPHDVPTTTTTETQGCIPDVPTTQQTTTTTTTRPDPVANSPYLRAERGKRDATERSIDHRLLDQMNKRRVIENWVRSSSTTTTT
eukprot:CAMPEP_0195020104 /NCGR_PEP_ID=MMETSP0326_2-20130528/34407_1 /TAXON_ID=2866 ORGANISM="Crypthecodinium cohnii, Strain Seligo" /NCGR_SAMPLE_ID=MMETSP0326_2 /ASSEMBLY_ACC=CAM_ASM_000348 /LENGTH=87 /DNA_ID=CAMNT_0040038545 /DNA_START=118 /DNA_END=377 /DNA_ORIENTATION=+